jgi:hypothetical protein
VSTFLETQLEHVFDITVYFGADRTKIGPLPGGNYQGYTPPTEGRIVGKRLNGIVVPHSGADYANVRRDGVVELNAHYLLQADDGALIYIANKGYLVPAPKSGATLNDQGMAQPRYFRCTPTFRAPRGRHAWLNQICIVGAGERRINPDHSIFRYYAVR